MPVANLGLVHSDKLYVVTCTNKLHLRRDRPPLPPANSVQCTSTRAFPHGMFESTGELPAYGVVPSEQNSKEEADGKKACSHRTYCSPSVFGVVVELLEYQT
jgi:hypothetical protein